ncbi:hypothetical protein [Streptomyces sp. NPDC058240]
MSSFKDYASAGPMCMATLNGQPWLTHIGPEGDMWTQVHYAHNNG